MEIRITKKEARENFTNLYAVRYGGLQNLLRDEVKMAYSCGVYGWSCDYFQLTGKNGQNLTISTGYSPVGKIIPISITEKYDQKVIEICRTSSKNKAQKIKRLINKFITEILSKKEI